MGSTLRLPAGLRVGLCLLALLGFLALLAPILATETPWVVRSPSGMEFPILSFSKSALPPTGTSVLQAPVPYSPNRLSMDETLEPPSARHWLGTDLLGRDLLARILHGGRVSLSVGLLAALFAALIGVPLGALAGYRGGWADSIVSRTLEAVLCFPAILLVLVIGMTSPVWLDGLSDVLRISLILGLTGWVPVARYLRAEFMRLRTSDMVAAARAGGGGYLRITLRHLLPCSLAPVLVTATFAVGAAIALEAGLSFLGAGVEPPQSTWGGLLNEAREQIRHAWWLAFFPGIALFLAILACNLVGEGIRDLLDPRRIRQ